MPVMSVHRTVGEGAVYEEMLAGPVELVSITVNSKAAAGMPPTVQI